MTEDTRSLELARDFQRNRDTEDFAEMSDKKLLKRLEAAGSNDKRINT